MFERFDDLSGQYAETAEIGWQAAQASVENIGKFLSMVLLVIVSSLIMVFMFPLWLLGKLSAQQSVHPTLLESADLQVVSTPEHSATSQTDQSPQQRG